MICDNDRKIFSKISYHYLIHSFIQVYRNIYRNWINRNDLILIYFLFILVHSCLLQRVCSFLYWRIWCAVSQVASAIWVTLLQTTTNCNLTPWVLVFQHLDRANVTTLQMRLSGRCYIVFVSIRFLFYCNLESIYKNTIGLLNEWMYIWFY